MAHNITPPLNLTPGLSGVGSLYLRKKSVPPVLRRKHLLGVVDVDVNGERVFCLHFLALSVSEKFNPCSRDAEREVTSVMSPHGRLWVRGSVSKRKQATLRGEKKCSVEEWKGGGKEGGFNVYFIYILIPSHLRYFSFNISHSPKTSPQHSTATNSLPGHSENFNMHVRSNALHPSCMLPAALQLGPVHTIVPSRFSTLTSPYLSSVGNDSRVS